VPWRIALGAVAIAGTLFILTAAIGLRERLIVAIPAVAEARDRRRDWAAGALIGLQWGGLVADSPGTLVTLGNCRRRRAPDAVRAAVIGILLARGLPGALLVGILVSTAAGLATGMVHYQGFAGLPPSLAPTLFQLDVAGALPARCCR
jgi:AGZA family xanthine/uracil permease-like MFS transporter